MYLKSGKQRLYVFKLKVNKIKMLSHVLIGLGLGLVSVGLFGIGFGCAIVTIPYYAGPWFDISGYSKGVIIEGMDYVVDMSEEP